MREARKDEESEAAHLAALDPGLRPPALPKAAPCQALCGALGTLGWLRSDPGHKDSNPGEGAVGASPRPPPLPQSLCAHTCLPWFYLWPRGTFFTYAVYPDSQEMALPRCPKVPPNSTCPKLTSWFPYCQLDPLPVFPVSRDNAITTQWDLRVILFSFLPRFPAFTAP